MKIIISILISFLTSLTFAQEVDIYSKWFAKVDDSHQLILDLTDMHSIGLTRIKVIDDKNYIIDSFGYKRRFNTIFIDVDSITVFFLGSIQPLHEKIETETRRGVIKAVDKNQKGVPQKILLSGDLPELSIYLDDGDTLSFTRMVIKEAEETEYRYFTQYGGEITYTRYTGEHGGFSMGIRDVGVQFSAVQLNKSMENKISTHVLEKINALRREKATDSLQHDLVLDTVSRDRLNDWLIESKKRHRLNINPDFEEFSKNDSSISLNPLSRFSINYYPFRCGQNSTAIKLVGADISIKNKLRKHITKYYKDYVDALLLACLSNSGMRQNIYNSGYAAVGNSLALYELVKDDFYFDHTGKKITIRDRKVKYYYLFLAQSFSVL